MSSMRQTSSYSNHEDGKRRRPSLQLDVSSSSSESDSMDDEERLKQLFSACDRDGDGFIDR
jgi:Ca2+-binding EF-hand superfamily protein